MSQSGILSVENSNPQIPTQFDTDSGSAVPIANTLEILGDNGTTTTGSGNTVTVLGVNATAAATVGAAQIGVAAFDSANFTVTSGFVSLAAGVMGIEGIISDDGNPSIVPDGFGNVSILGGTGIATSGQGPGTTLTISADSNVATTYTTDSGNAVPASNILNVLGGTAITTAGATDTVSIDLNPDALTTAVEGWNGSILETSSVVVASDGATITLSIEKVGGGDLTVVFSDGFYDWDTTPADTVTLTAGTDTAPQINYVYFLQSNKTLTASTVGWPATEHATVATVICQSAASLQTQGAYNLFNWTNHVVNTNEIGHIPDLNYWIRSQSATWVSGVLQTYDITTNVGTPDNVNIDTGAGVVLQIHLKDFPAFTTVHDYYVINDSVTPYDVVTDLNELLTDSAGGSLSGKYFSLVMWGTVSEDTGEAKLYINLPGGSYNNSASLLSDTNSFTNYTIPSDFIGSGFLISQWNLRHQAVSGGTWTTEDTFDLRGLKPSISPGGVTSGQNEFDDSLFRIYDDGDDTKKIAFQVSPVDTSTTRTITAANYDIDLATVCISSPTDSGTAIPSAGALTVAGGTLLNTSASGSTVTVNADDSVVGTVGSDSGTATPSTNNFDIVGSGGITTSGATDTITIDGSAFQQFAWNVETGTSASMAVNNGYIGNNAGTVTFTLPASAAVGDMFRVTGLQGAWVIAQNAGDTIHFGDQSTTTGVGGSLASTDARDAVEIVCVVANTDFQILSSVGNITVT